LIDRELVRLEDGTTRGQLVRFGEFWARGEFHSIASYAALCEGEPTPAELTEFMRTNDGRNPAMAERIDAIHTGGQKVLAAFGALHMIGTKNLPQLLRERGYDVERVRFAA
jgi:uncharacterized protein